MRTRWVLVVLVVGMLFVAGPGFLQGAPGSGGVPDLVGVYKSEGFDLILANHPLVRSEFIGQILYGAEHKILPMRIACDSVKGCHGVIFDGSIDRSVELKIEGDKLTLRYYSGPTLLFKREKQP